MPVLVILANLVNGFITKTPWPFLAAFLVMGCCGFGLYASRRGKFVVWANLLRDLKLRGDEHVLDLVCGRGAVLLLAAQHLSTGRAVGVDLWRKGDQSGNAAEATRQNAIAEGVTDRVELHTASMTELPFLDNSFDLVPSSIAVHNVRGKLARNSVPRSAYDRTGGIVYSARMLHKIRLRAAGTLRADYHANLGSGFDGRCCRFIGVEYSALRDRVLEGGTDDDILGWCFALRTRPGDEQVLVWNKFMLKRGWRDEDDGSTQELERYKASSGLADRKDILTFFDYYEVDEGRRP